MRGHQFEASRNKAGNVYSQFFGHGISIVSALHQRLKWLQKGLTMVFRTQPTLVQRSKQLGQSVTMKLTETLISYQASDSRINFPDPLAHEGTAPKCLL